jgi:hypothetical protein
LIAIASEAGNLLLALNLLRVDELKISLPVTKTSSGILPGCASNALCNHVTLQAATRVQTALLSRRMSAPPR